MKKLFIVLALTGSSLIVQAQTIYKQDQYNHLNRQATVIQNDNGGYDVYQYDRYNQPHKMKTIVPTDEPGKYAVYEYDEYKQPRKVGEIVIPEEQ